MTKHLLKTFVAVLAIAATAINPAWGQNTMAVWPQTAYGDLQTGDTVIIVDKTSAKALPSPASSTTPSAVSVTLNSAKDTLTGTPAANLLWVVTKNGNTYQFKQPGSSNYLYITDASNGVRVGNNENNQFSFANGGTYNVPFLKHNFTSRYLGLTDAYEWRSLSSNSSTSTIKNTVIGFYKKTVIIIPTYTARFAEGTEDVGNWSITPAEATTTGMAQGSELTATYNGTQKVKSVKAVKYIAPWDGNLADIPAWAMESDNVTVVVPDGLTLYNTLSQNYKIVIADGATVTLNNASISYSGNGADYAGLTLLGDGTLVLVDGTENNLIGGLDGGGYSNWPGIYVPEGKTLTIDGSTGVLNAARGGNDVDDGSPAGIGAAWGSNAGNIVINGGVINATGGGKGAGIGGCGRRGCGYITINGGTVTATGGKYGPGIGIGGSNSNPVSDGGTCGDITITGGTVTATGGQKGAGIGTGYASNNGESIVTKICGNILINGGTVTATGGANAAGIGTGEANNEKGIITVGTITITDGVERVTATAGSGATNSIGVGSGTNATCGTVTVGGVEGAITTSPYTYQP